MTVTYQPATRRDVIKLSKSMRAIDRTEAEDATGESPAVALMRSWEQSYECFSARDADGVVAIWGISPGATEDAGCPWMVCTDRAANYAKLLIKDARVTVNQWSNTFPVIENYVGADNATSIAWLQVLGFTIGTLIPDFGVGKKPFYHFFRINHVRCSSSSNADYLGGVSGSNLRAG